MRKRDGKLEKEALRPTLFVPMTGTAEEQRDKQADPANPQLVNGDFEQPPAENGYMPGWYYQRGLTWKGAGDSPSGSHFVQFENQAQGRPTSLLQGLALDGRLVKRIRLSASIKLDNVRPGADRSELPGVTIRFFDEQRSLLGTQWIGLIQGTRDWRSESKVMRVPLGAREAIVSIGLFGATGVAGFDRIELEAIR